MTRTTVGSSTLALFVFVALSVPMALAMAAGDAAQGTPPKTQALSH